MKRIYRIIPKVNGSFRVEYAYNNTRNFPHWSPLSVRVRGMFPYEKFDFDTEEEAREVVRVDKEYWQAIDDKFEREKEFAAKNPAIYL